MGVDGRAVGVGRCTVAMRGSRHGVWRNNRRLADQSRNRQLSCRSAWRSSSRAAQGSSGRSSIDVSGGSVVFINNEVSSLKAYSWRSVCGLEEQETAE